MGDSNGTITVVGKRVIGYKKRRLEDMNDGDCGLASKMSGEIVDLTLGSAVNLVNKLTAIKSRSHHA